MDDQTPTQTPDPVEVVVPAAAIPGGRLTRRDVLRLLGLGGAGMTVGAAALAVTRSEGGLTAPLAIQGTATNGEAGLAVPTVADKAAELLYDPQRIFRFVADEVAYEAYPGALRGAKGTLWSLAGNAVDQALLLAALLDEALVAYRFVIGELDDDSAAQLLQAMSIDAATARARTERALVRPVPNDNRPPLTPEEAAFVSDMPEQGERILEAGRAQLAEHTGLILDALSAGGVDLPQPVLALPERERRQHVWLQIAAGPAWMDLDPSVPGAEYGVAVATPTGTVDVLPDNLYHMLNFRLEAESIVGGAPIRQELVSHQARVVDLVGVPVTVLNVRPESFKGIGLSIAGQIEGTRQYIPYLVFGQEILRGTLFGLGTGEGFGTTLFGEESSREGDTLAQWLVIDIAGPDATPVTVEREFFDRVGVAARAAGEVDPTAVPPVELTPTEDDEEPVFLPAHQVLSIAVMGGLLPLNFFGQVDTGAGAYSTLGLVAHAAHHLRDVLAVEAATAHGLRFYPNGPNLMAMSVRPATWDGEASTAEFGLDILHRSVQAVPLAGANPVLHPLVFGGVLSTVAERFALGDGLPPEAVSPGDTTEMPSGTSRDDSATISVLGLFEEAARQGIPITTIILGESDGVLANSAYSARAKVRIRAGLDAGMVVVVPERPVALAEEEATGWWLIEPATGRTVDVMETGRGQMAEEIVIVDEDIQQFHWYRRLGCQLAIGYAIAALIAGLGTGLATGNPGLGVSAGLVALANGGVAIYKQEASAATKVSDLCKGI